MQGEIRQIEAMMADRTASPADIETWQQLSEDMAAERERLDAFVWAEEVSNRDRTIMQWIMRGES
ncbi:MAG: hypothetical protein MK085_01720 [Phycisphaerales bacterium]|nr:hypothetical protein [Phycisphaerales bacterium]